MTQYTDYEGKTPEESGQFYGEAHAWQDFITEVVDEEMARLWLTAYDHAVEQWEYDMPNPLDVWEEFYLPTTRATTRPQATTDDHDHARMRDHTGAQARRHVYAWARAYASAYRDATARLMRGIVDKARTETMTHDSNGVAGVYGA